MGVDQLDTHLIKPTPVRLHANSCYGHLHATVGTDNTARRPSTLLCTKHSYHTSDLVCKCRSLPTHTLQYHLVIFLRVATCASLDHRITAFVIHQRSLIALTVQFSANSRAQTRVIA